jgi:hypothetical protein
MKNAYGRLLPFFRHSYGEWLAAAQRRTSFSLICHKLGQFLPLTSSVPASP